MLDVSDQDIMAMAAEAVGQEAANALTNEERLRVIVARLAGGEATEASRRVAQEESARRAAQEEATRRELVESRAREEARAAELARIVTDAGLRAGVGFEGEGPNVRRIQALEESVRKLCAELRAKKGKGERDEEDERKARKKKAPRWSPYEVTQEARSYYADEVDVRGKARALDMSLRAIAMVNFTAEKKAKDKGESDLEWASGAARQAVNDLLLQIEVAELHGEEGSRAIVPGLAGGWREDYRDVMDRVAKASRSKGRTGIEEAAEAVDVYRGFRRPTAQITEGTKCFGCGGYGHVQAKCTERAVDRNGDRHGDRQGKRGNT